MEWLDALSEGIETLNNMILESTPLTEPWQGYAVMAGVILLLLVLLALLIRRRNRPLKIYRKDGTTDTISKEAFYDLVFLAVRDVRTAGKPKVSFKRKKKKFFINLTCNLYEGQKRPIQNALLKERIIQVLERENLIPVGDVSVHNPRFKKPNKKIAAAIKQDEEERMAGIQPLALTTAASAAAAHAASQSSEDDAYIDVPETKAEATASPMAAAGATAGAAETAATEEQIAHETAPGPGDRTAPAGDESLVSPGSVATAAEAEDEKPASSPSGEVESANLAEDPTVAASGEAPGPVPTEDSPTPELADDSLVDAMISDEIVQAETNEAAVESPVSKPVANYATEAQPEAAATAEAPPTAATGTEPPVGEEAKSLFGDDDFADMAEEETAPESSEPEDEFGGSKKS